VVETQNIRRKLFEVSTALVLGVALEPTFFKPGCVHPSRSFVDKKLLDFYLCASAMHPTVLEALIRGSTDPRSWNPVVGDLIRRCMERVCFLATGRNPCLGTALLIHVAALGIGNALSVGSSILEGLERATSIVREFSSVEDAVELYRAVRLACPSYVSPRDRVEMPNVWSPRYEEELRTQNVTLWRVLLYSASIDLPSREIVEGFPRSRELASRILKLVDRGYGWSYAVLRTFLELGCRELDTTTLRRYGKQRAEELRRRLCEALQLLNASEDRWKHLEQLDEKLAREGLCLGSLADILALALGLALTLRLALNA